MSSRPNNKMLKRSAFIMAFLLLFGFGIGLVSLVKIQLVKSEYYKQGAELQQLSDKTISAGRGTIYDRNMKVLAQSATAWRVYIVPSKIKSEDDKNLIADGLAGILGMDRETIYEKTSLSNGYEIIKRKIDVTVKNSVAQFISENELGQQIGIDEDSKRYYPYGQFASKLIGFTGTDDQGLDGIEKTYDEELTGTAGRVVTAKDAKQREMPVQFETTVDAQEGNSLVLTIDEVIQYYLEKNLEQAYIDNKATSATGIVMEVKTGAVLGMSTKPDYNPNDPFTIQNDAVKAAIEAMTEGEARTSALSNAQQSQWRNNAISDTYEPGSVFKMVTAAAAIEEGVVNEGTMFSCKGFVNVAGWRINCHNRSGHGSETFAEGLQNSCNPVFISVAQSLGVEKFYDYVEAFGLTEPTGIDLVGEVNGIFHNKDTMGISELSSSSFGQTFTVTPIQMITAVNAIANGGKLVTPYVVKEVIDEDGNTVSETKTEVKRQVISEETSKRICSMLEQVVLSGTGKNAYVAGYRVAGKTGTSEKVGNTNADGSKKYIASFCAFAPADDPEIVVLILIDEPTGESYSGSTIAGPIVANILENTLQYLDIEPEYTEEELAALDINTPSVVSMNVNDATSALETEGLNVRVIGDGETVIKQNPLADQPIPKTGTVILYTQEENEGNTTIVPDLQGMTISQANKAIANAGLNIKLTGTSLENSEAVVYSQSVAAGREVDLGTVITVTFKHILDETYVSVYDDE